MKDARLAAAVAAMHQQLPAELFSGLLAIAADAVIAVDHEQRIIFFNEGAERIFGWSAAEVGGQYLEMLLPERYRAAHRGHVRGFGLASGHARQMGERQQISGLRKSGEEFPAEAAIERIEVGGREVFAAVLRDISARQRVEDALRQAVHARDDMMGIVSHDLRNPANAIKMLIRSVLEEETPVPLSDGITERLQVVRQAAEQIDALIQDLLDVSRLEAGRLTVSRVPADVRWLVSRSVEAMRPHAETSGVALRMNVPADLPIIRADPDRVLQTLSNVIGNAIKFTPGGGSVLVTVELKGDAVEFAVSDTGIGVAADLLPRVFDRFFQVSSATGGGRRHGAGLGLPIARGIVEAHGGQIWMESDVTTGTTVRFTLPIN